MYYYYIILVATEELFCADSTLHIISNITLSVSGEGGENELHLSAYQSYYERRGITNCCGNLICCVRVGLARKMCLLILVTVARPFPVHALREDCKSVSLSA